MIFKELHHANFCSGILILHIFLIDVLCSVIATYQMMFFFSVAQILEERSFKLKDPVWFCNKMLHLLLWFSVSVDVISSSITWFIQPVNLSSVIVADPPYVVRDSLNGENIIFCKWLLHYIHPSLVWSLQSSCWTYSFSSY